MTSRCLAVLALYLGSIDEWNPRARASLLGRKARWALAPLSWATMTPVPTCPTGLVGG